MARQTHNSKSFRRRFMAKMDALQEEVLTMRKEHGIPSNGFTVVDSYKRWELRQMEELEATEVGGRFPSERFHSQIDRLMDQAVLSPRWRDATLRWIIMNDTGAIPSKGGFRLVNHNGEMALVIDPGLTVEDLKKNWAVIKSIVWDLQSRKGMATKERYRDADYLDKYAEAYRLRRLPQTYSAIAKTMGLDDSRQAREMVEFYEKWLQEPI